MISWWGLFRNALWIVGLAVGLAAWSYARWWAQQNRVRLRQVINMPLFVVPFSAGLALFSLGLALSGRRWWEIAAWAVLTVLCVGQGVYSWLTDRRRDEKPALQQHAERP